MKRFLFLGWACAVLICCSGKLAHAKDSEPVPFTLVDNRIFVDVLLNGQGPFHLILDTGAGATVSIPVAKKLGLPRESTTELSGVGDATVQGYDSHLKTIAIGPTKLENIAVNVISFDDSPMVFGNVPVDGYIGFQFFQKYVVAHDYLKKTVTFLDPESFKYDGKGTVLAIEEADYAPIVNGALDGILTKFAIDTGARSALLLFSPFVADHQMRDRYKPKFSGVTGWGIGGPVRSEIARIESITLGDVTVKQVVARFSQNQSGGTTDRSIAGLLGPDILKQFTVIYDLPRKRLILEKNTSFGARDTYDKAGAWLIPGTNGFEILDIISGGPADRAGLKVGDEIISIDGKPASSLALPEVRDRWKYSPAGTTIRLKVQSQGKYRNVVLKLEELV